LDCTRGLRIFALVRHGNPTKWMAARRSICGF